MDRTIRLPKQFKDWSEYESAYAVEVLLDARVLRCMTCGSEWGMEHNRGKLLQRVHRCPAGCNGAPRSTRRYVGRPEIDRPLTLGELRAALGDDAGLDAFERSREAVAAKAAVRREAGQLRRRPAKIWMTVRQVAPERWTDLDHLWDEAAAQADPLAFVHRGGRR